ncbi:MAG: hypothetical protein QM758_17215 [Armatimonas sp.]
MEPSLLMVNATDINRWASHQESRNHLPRLLRRLIQFSSTDIEWISFPSDESIYQGGFDGVVRTNNENTFVPKGKSFWEIGTDSDIKGKADDDYDKRIKEVPNEEKKVSTFIFVTPRRWSKKNTWIKEKSKDSLWLNVRAYDADDLVTWLEICPAVLMWFSELIEKKPHGAQSLEFFWEKWSSSTSPSFSADLIIGGRNNEAKLIIDKINEHPSAFSVQGDSIQDAVAFISASIIGNSINNNDVLSRSVIIDDVSSWGYLSQQTDKNLILIPRFEFSEGFDNSLENRHHVIIPCSPGNSHADVVLPRIQRDAAESALKAMGISYEQGKDMATLARRSFSALRRKFAKAPLDKRPIWASPSEARTLLGALLAGAWIDHCEGDRRILSQLSGMPYEEVQKNAMRWVHESDPPLRNVGQLWFVAAREDMWRLIARYLTSDDLRRFEQAAIEVLSEPDPTIGLSSSENLVASLRGKVRAYSSNLRQGIAESLSLMSALSDTEDGKFCFGQSGDSVSNRIVRRILLPANDDISNWMTIEKELCLIAEACPEEFLDAVEDGFDTGCFDHIFQVNDEDFFSRWSPHTYLLWALETLAWSPEYLDRSSLYLAKLMRIDPKHKNGNHPDRSLYHIFLPWLPCTSANFNQRILAIDNIRKNEPDVAWTMMFDLLPTGHNRTHFTHRPNWKDWAPDSLVHPPDIEMFNTISALIERLIADAGNCIHRWCQLIVASARSSYRDHYDLLFDAFNKLKPADFSSKEVALFRDQLRKIIIRHKEFPDADWSLPKDLLSNYEKLSNEFEPQDIIDIHGWLFKRYVPIAERLTEDWEKRDRLILEHRVNALDDILQKKGVNGIYQIAELSEDSTIVGNTLIQSGIAFGNIDAFIKDVISQENEKLHGVVSGILFSGAIIIGEEWMQERINFINDSDINETLKGKLFLFFPIRMLPNSAIDDASSEACHYFWTNVHHIGYPENRERLIWFLDNLIQYERPYILIDDFSYYLNKENRIAEVDDVIRLLEACLIHFPKSKSDMPQNFGYHLGELLDYLNEQDASHDKQIFLEWNFMRFLSYSRRPKKLQKELSTNPNFFIQVISIAYLQDNGEPDSESQIDDLEEEQKKYLIEQSSELLYHWNTIPGQLEGGTIDKDELNNWIEEVRKLATECNRLHTVDRYIGKVFSHSPVDIDNTWPNKNIREQMESINNKDLFDAFENQVFNNRGVTTRMPTDGGQQERFLVERYRNFSTLIKRECPRVARLLGRIAASYDRDASREDINAELTQDFWR